MDRGKKGSAEIEKLNDDEIRAASDPEADYTGLDSGGRLARTFDDGRLAKKLRKLSAGIKVRPPQERASSFPSAMRE
jgi:hypothetical protein